MPHDDAERGKTSIDATAIGIRRPGIASLTGWSALAAAILPCFLGLGFGNAGIALGGFAAAVTLLLTSIVLASAGSRRPGRLEVRDREIVLHTDRGARVVPRERIRSAWIVPGSRACRLEVALSRGDVLHASIATHDAERALAALGCDVGQKRVAVSLGGKTQAALVFVWTAIFGFIPAAMLWDWMHGQFPELPWSANLVSALMLDLSLATTATWLFGPGSLVVGSDGVRIRRSIGTRFISHRDIESANGAAPDEIVIALRGGGQVRVRASNLVADDRRAMAARITAAARAWRPADGGHRELFSRKGRTFGEWREALRAMLLGTGSYRDAAVSREDVVRVLHDPTATSEQRIGAAIALTADDAGADEVRAAAEASASERLRVAFESVSREAVDDAALEQALADESPQVRAKS